MATSSVALAQPAPEYVPVQPRVGLELGGGLWAGKMYCDSQNGSCSGLAAAGGANLQAGWFFNPRLGVYADVWAMAHTESSFTLTHEISTAGLAWRPIPILTLQAGIGGAHASFSYNGLVLAKSATGFAVMAGASLDVIRARRWALSVGARVGSGFYGDNNGDGKPDVTGRNVGVGAQITLFGF